MAYYSYDDNKWIIYAGNLNSWDEMDEAYLNTPSAAAYWYDLTEVGDMKSRKFAYEFSDKLNDVFDYVEDKKKGPYGG